MITPAITRLFESLEQGATAITSTRRLARQVEQRYAAWKTARGAAAWPTPHIRVQDDWLLETWQSAFELEPGAPRLLSEDQELLLWEDAIRRGSGDDQYILQLTGTARAARRTWRRIHEWRLDWNRLRRVRGADTEAFLGWAETVREQLRDRSWLTQAQLPDHLLDGGAALRSASRPLWWMGFDTVPPLYQRVMTTLEGRGCAPRRYDNAGVMDAAVSVSECGDSKDQWTRIARWARSELAADAHRSLGVVCPDLHARRDEIEDILEDVMHPELAWRGDAPRAFHLSLGRPLSDYPIVGAALDLLRWTGSRIPFETLSRTLRSPYLGAGDADLEARAELEVRLRKPQRETFTLGHLAALADRGSGLESFRQALASASAVRMPRSADPARWASLFSEWLRAFGWPGGRSLDSHEFQTVNAWREQLVRFAALAAVQSRWTLAGALKQLSAMTSARILQFHDDQAPLQIMGITEAPALWFDEMWLADMSDSVWPPPAQPDPFIPVSLQKECGMPDASPQSMLALTRSRTTNLLASAGAIRVSFVSRDEETPVTVSPLFDQYPLGGEDHLEEYNGRVDQLLGTAAPLERVADHQAPGLEGAHLHGGVSRVADQARCPFRALAHHRLHVRELPEVAPGLSAMERGTLVHEAAKRLWDRLGDSQNLNAAAGEQHRELVGEAVTGALAGKFADSPFQARFLEIEHERLCDLLVEWLALESARAPFRVAGTEIDASLELGGMEFAIRVDRIDELEDGRRLIIDYKTGDLAKIKDWADPRIEEPQLPMYALSLATGVGALALAGIRRGRCELRGVGDHVDGIPSLKPLTELGFEDMGRLMSWWRSALGGLVTEHRQGVARVEPKNPQICRLCDAMALCRIFERAQGVE